MKAKADCTPSPQRRSVWFHRPLRPVTMASHSASPNSAFVSTHSRLCRCSRLNRVLHGLQHLVGVSAQLGLFAVDWPPVLSQISQAECRDIGVISRRKLTQEWCLAPSPEPKLPRSFASGVTPRRNVPKDPFGLSHIPAAMRDVRVARPGSYGKSGACSLLKCVSRHVLSRHIAAFAVAPR